MKIRFTFIKNGFLIVVLLTTLFSCNSKKSSEPSGKINIIVSILPQKTFVKAVGKELVNVSELIPPGGSPATYEPKPSDLVKVEKADIYFRIGHIPFEKSHTHKLIELNPDIKVVDTSQNVKLRYLEESDEHEDHHHEAGIDPHIWLSPVQVKIQIETIAKALIKFDPENEEFYIQNAKDFQLQLEKIDNDLRVLFRNYKGAKLLVFHPSWGYFTDDYSLQQVAIEADGKDPTAEQLQHFLNLAKEENIKVIFVQSQFNKKIAQSIADEIDAVIVSIDPLAEDYIINLKKVASTITEYLKR
jgi:zinc transport system substrate-binding protein